MFGIGVPELMLILALALIVLGPEKLPQLAKQIARFLGELKRASEEFKQQLDVDGMEEIKELKNVANLRNPETWRKNLDRFANPENRVDSLAPPEHIAGPADNTAETDLPGGLGPEWRIASGSGRDEERRGDRVINDVINPEIHPSVLEGLENKGAETGSKEVHHGPGTDRPLAADNNSEKHDA